MFIRRIMKYMISLLLLIGCTNSQTDEELNKLYYESFEKREWTNAIKYMDELIERHPNEAYTYYARAIAKSNLKENTDVKIIIEDLNKSLELDSSNTKALLLRFQAELLNSDYDSSLENINSLIKIVGRNPFLLKWKGNCAFLAKKFEIAENAYDKRLNIEGDYDELKKIYYYWIYSMYFGGKKERALRACEIMPNLKLEKDTLLLKKLRKDDLVWEELAKFTIPQTSIEELDILLKEKGK